MIYFRSELIRGNNYHFREDSIGKLLPLKLEKRLSKYNEKLVNKKKKKAIGMLNKWKNKKYNYTIKEFYLLRGRIICKESVILIYQARNYKSIKLRPQVTQGLDEKHRKNKRLEKWKTQRRKEHGV